MPLRIAVESYHISHANPSGIIADSRSEKKNLQIAYQGKAHNGMTGFDQKHKTLNFADPEHAINALVEINYVESILE